MEMYVNKVIRLKSEIKAIAIKWFRTLYLDII